MPLGRHLILALLSLLVLGMAAAACGDDDNSAAASKPPPNTRAAAGNDGEVLVTYKGKQNIDAKLISKSGLAEAIADAINESIALPADVTIVFGGDPDGPYYDPEDGTIQYPWKFVAETRRLLTESGYKRGEQLDTAIIDATRFILGHEAAHALINQLDIPVLGKEEDAADSFASYFAVEYDDDGEGVIAASDLFGAYQDEGDESAFFDSHSLDAQRFYTISCQVYGADTKRYASVVEGIGIDKERLAECPAEYEQLSTSWKRVLKPHLLAGARQ